MNIFNLSHTLSRIKRPAWILITIIVVGFGIRLYLATFSGYPADIEGWSRLSSNVTHVGVAHVYDPGIHDPFYGIYPPLYHVALALVGGIYERFFSPDFALNTPTLNFLLKLMPSLAECALAILVYLIVRRNRSERLALWSAGFFMFNPAVLYTTGYWGMFGDALYTLCIVLALYAVQTEHSMLVGIALAAGIMLKPQAVIFAPLIVWWSVSPFSWRRVGYVGAGFAVTMFILWLPYLIAGTLGYAIDALRGTTDLFPMLSANAHNLWYLISQGNGSTSDVEPIMGMFNARTIGLVAVGIAYIFVLFRAQKQPLIAAAYVGFAFFMLSTQMHENYLYPTVVLLMIVWFYSRTLSVLAIVITLTSLANMALHDALYDPVMFMSVDTVNGLRLFNAGVNVAAFVGWTLSLLWVKNVIPTDLLKEREAATH